MTTGLISLPHIWESVHCLSSLVLNLIWSLNEETGHFWPSQIVHYCIWRGALFPDMLLKNVNIANGRHLFLHELGSTNQGSFHLEFKLELFKESLQMGLGPLCKPLNTFKSSPHWLCHFCYRIAHFLGANMVIYLSMKGMLYYHCSLFYRLKGTLAYLDGYLWQSATAITLMYQKA